MARYDGLRKLERNSLLVKYREEHPDASLQEIATLFNISKQRIWELLVKERAKELAAGSNGERDKT